MGGMGLGPGHGQGQGMSPGQMPPRSDSDSDANYYPGGPPRYLRKIGGQDAAIDRQGSHSENRPPYGYPLAQEKGKGRESDGEQQPRSFDLHPLDDNESFVDSNLGSNEPTVVASAPANCDSPHQSEETIMLSRGTPQATQVDYSYEAPTPAAVPGQYHYVRAVDPDSPPPTPPTIQDFRQSWSAGRVRLETPPLPAVVTDEDIKDDENIQTSLSSAIGVDDYVAAAVHLNRNPSVITGAHVTSIAVPLDGDDDETVPANNVDQERPRTRGHIERPTSHRMSAPPASRDGIESVPRQHTRSVSTSQLNKTLPPPPIDVERARAFGSTASLASPSSASTTSAGSATKRSSLFFRKSGPPSPEKLREMEAQDTLSKEHIVSWVDRRRPDGKRIFSGGPYDAV